jgi:hypothetical protein
MNSSSLVCSELSALELDSVSGGNFAYDVGRALRFLWISGANGAGTGEAIVDWYVNDLVHQA